MQLDENAAIWALVRDLRRLYVVVDAPRADRYPVAETLTDELEARGWDVGQFSVSARMPVDAAAEILAGARITRHSAERIAAALGTSVQFWRNLDARTPAPAQPEGGA